MSASRNSAKKGKVDTSGGMGDLVGESELPAGFRYIPDVLSPVEEQVLVREFERLPLKPFEFHGHQGHRRIYTLHSAPRGSAIA